jgi:hypothetical protein
MVGVRAEILQVYRADKYLLLCCICNKLEAQKQVRSEPYIQQALTKLDRLNLNNSIENTYENNHDVLQMIQLNIVICLLYLFIFFILITTLNLTYYEIVKTSIILFIDKNIVKAYDEFLWKGCDLK